MLRIGVYLLCRTERPPSAFVKEGRKAIENLDFAGAESCFSQALACLSTLAGRRWNLFRVKALIGLGTAKSLRDPTDLADPAALRREARECFEMAAQLADSLNEIGWAGAARRGLELTRRLSAECGECGLEAA